MYSLVLMSAMSTAPAGPEFNGYFRDLFSRSDRNGCTGCNGCSGAARYNCYGGCSGASYSCNGCCGGGAAFLGIRDRIRTWWNANGCCGGGCCGGSMAYAAGCSGSMAYSCFGGPVESYTPIFNGGLSCYGGPVAAAPAPIFDPVPAPAYPYAAPLPPASVPYAPPEAAPPTVVPERMGVRPAAAATVTAANGGGTASRATVVVRLPADAKLYADGTALRMTGPERKFVTPELPDGMEFTYKFTAEYERNGEVVSVTRKVAVRPGGTEAVEFVDLTATRPTTAGEKDAPPVRKGDAVAAAPVALSKESDVTPAAPAATTVPAASRPTTERATIVVKLPAGAALYVDDKKNPSSEPVRRFTTPPLPAGREFGYLLKAEVIRDGHPETLTQKVAFRAGEQVVVDLTSLGTGR